MRHNLETANAEGTMGTKQRIVRSDGKCGPWVIGKKPTAAWKAYKKMRKDENRELPR